MELTGLCPSCTPFPMKYPSNFVFGNGLLGYEVEEGIRRGAWYAQRQTRYHRNYSCAIKVLSLFSIYGFLKSSETGKEDSE